MVAGLEGVAHALCAFAFGLLTQELNVTKFPDVAHVRSGARAHVDTIPDLNNAKFLDACREQVHVGSVGWHDGVDFVARHDSVRNGQFLVNALVGGGDEVVEHVFIEGNRIEINS